MQYCSGDSNFCEEVLVKSAKDAEAAALNWDAAYIKASHLEFMEK